MNITPEMYDVHIKRQVACSKIVAFISIPVQIGDIIFQFVSGNDMIWLIAFPIIYILLMLLHLRTLSKPLDVLKRERPAAGGIVGEIIAAIILLFGNIITMVFSINGIFFVRNVNFGVIPLTVFSIMTFMIHNGAYWAFVNLLNRQAYVEKHGNPLLPPPPQNMPPAPQGAQYPPGYSIPAPPQGYVPPAQPSGQGFVAQPNNYLAQPPQHYPPPPGAYPPQMAPNAPAPVNQPYQAPNL